MKRGSAAIGPLAALLVFSLVTCVVHVSATICLDGHDIGGDVGAGGMADTYADDPVLDPDAADHVCLSPSQDAHSEMDCHAVCPGASCLCHQAPILHEAPAVRPSDASRAHEYGITLARDQGVVQDILHIPIA